jgi:hypothetical protein
MEEDSREILSPLLTKPQAQKQFEQLEKVVAQAQKRVDYSVAHDADVLKAIEIVERFLRRNKRICYGGQAINALLPKERQFYDPETSVPDYDFFSPNVSADVEELIDELEKEGFSNVNKKLGVHEGTMKVYVNFIPVADCSSIDPKLFRIILKRSKVINGIHYCDPDFLRMLMYLELSRPRGEVSRWKKVYERLLLLNDSYPVPQCNETIRVPHVMVDDRATVLDFCLKHKRVVVGAEFIEYLEKDKGQTHMETLVKRDGPVLFFSPKAANDAEDIKLMLVEEGGGALLMKDVEALTDQLFNFVTIKRRGKPIALIFQEDACHAYTLLHIIEAGAQLRVATPDLYLHLYYSLLIFGKAEKSFFETSLECLIGKLYTVLKNVRGKPGRFTPAFGLKCSGRQKGIATLLREKAERTEKEKRVGRNSGSGKKTRKRRA